MFPPGFEPGTFCVLDRCDNHYTTKTTYLCLNFNLVHYTWPSCSTRLFSMLILKSVLSRDRLVVRTLRCGRSNPGSNPGHGMDKNFLSTKEIGLNNALN